MLDQSTSPAAFAALLLALLGTALASWQEPTFCALSAALMFTVNSCLTFRNAATKRILRRFGALAKPAVAASSSERPGEVEPKANWEHHLHGQDSTRRCNALATPVAAARNTEQARQVEPQQPREHHQDSSMKDSGGVGVPQHAVYTPEALSCVLLALTNLSGLVGILLLWAGHDWYVGGGSFAASLLFFSNQGEGWVLPEGAAGLLGSVGVSNLLYNMASQIFLAHVSVVSHGMLELFKRVFVLLCASALLDDVEWAWHNAAGAALASAGTLLYFSAVQRKHAEGASPPRPSHGAVPHMASAAAVPAAMLPDNAAGRLVPPHKHDAGSAPHAHARTCSGASKLTLAYALIACVLLASPVEFAAGAGVVSWMPVWMRPGAAWTRVADAAAADVHAPPQPQTTPRTHGADSSVGDAAAPLVLAPLDARMRLAAAMVQPGVAALLGGPHLPPVLPYHVGLARSSREVPAELCAAPNGGVRGSVTQRLGSASSRSRVLSGTGGGAASRGLGSSVSSSREGLGGSGGGATSRRLAAGGSHDDAPGLAGGSHHDTRGLAGVYSGWLGHGNLGDEIVGDIFLDMLAGALVGATSQDTCVSIERSSAQLLEAGWNGCSVEVREPVYAVQGDKRRPAKHFLGPHPGLISHSPAHALMVGVACTHTHGHYIPHTHASSHTQ